MPLFKTHLVAALVAMTMISCTRSAKESTKVRLDLPETVSTKSGKLNTQSAGMMLGHAVINVTGPEMEPIVMQWDACHDCQSMPPAPEFFELEVPRGDNRLVQVLLVYMSENSSMTFFYGDKSQEIQDDEEFVAVDMGQLGTAGSVFGGSIAGRYITQEGTAPSGPTGTVLVQYRPIDPANPDLIKPKMIIEKGQIINGWFNFFALSSVPFDYTLEDGTPIFENLKLDDINSSAQVAKSFAPAHYSQRSENGVTSWRAGEPEIRVLGFFAAPGVTLTSKDACTNIAESTSISNWKLASDGTGASPTHHIQSFNNAPGAFHSDVTKANTFAAMTCSANPPWINVLKMDSAFYSSGKEKFAGFYLTNVVSGSNNELFNATMSGGTGTVSMTTLPGIAGNDVDDFAIYAGQNWSSSINDRNVPCAEIQMGFMPGWEEVGVATRSGMTDLFSGTVDITGGSFDKMAVCPRKDGYSLGFGFGKYMMMGSNPGGGMSGTLDHLAVRVMSDYGLVGGTNGCVQLVVRGEGASDMGPMNLSESYSATITGGTGNLYASQMGCQYSYTNEIVSPVVTLGPSQSSVMLYKKIPEASGSIAFSLTAVTGTARPNVDEGDTVTVVPGTNIFAQLEIPFKIMPNLCYSGTAMVAKFDNGGVSALSLAMAATTDVSYFTDSTCTTALTTAPPSMSGNSYVQFYFKYTPSGTAAQSISLTTAISGVDHQATRMVQVDPVMNTTIAMVDTWISGMSTTLNWDQCYQLETYIKNSNGTPIPSDGSLFTASTTGSSLSAIFYTDLYCGTTGANYTIPAGKTGGRYSFKPLGPVSGGTIDVSVSGVSHQISGVNVLGPYFTIAIQSTANDWECVPFTVERRTPQGNSLYNGAGAALIDLSASAGFAQGFYTDADCSQGISTIAIAGNQSSVQAYVRVKNSTGSASSVNVNANNNVSNTPPYQPISGFVSVNPAPTLPGSHGGITMGANELLILDTLPLGARPYTLTSPGAVGSNEGGNYRAGAAASTITIQDARGSSLNISIAVSLANLKMDFINNASLGAGISSPNALTVPTMSITRASSGTFYDVNGLLQTAASNVERIDHDPSDATGCASSNCKRAGLLIEPAKTNEITYSNTFNSGGWDTSGIFGVVTSNDSGVTAPDGTTTATTLLDDNSNTSNVSRFFNQFTTDLVNGQVYVASVYAKKGTSSCAVLNMNENVTGCSGVSYNFDTDTVAGSGYCSTASARGVQKLKNGWVRMWVAYTAQNTTYQGYIAMYPNCGAGGAMDNSLTGSVSFWGAQVEQGGSMTSYIPTSGATATRNADIINSSALGNWFNSSTGTFAIEWDQKVFTNGPTVPFDVGLLSGSLSRSKLMTNSSMGISVGHDTGTNLLTSNVSNALVSGNNAVAYSYSGTTLNTSVGTITTVGSSAGGSGSTADTLVLGNSLNGGNFMSGHIKRLMYWNTVLSPEAMNSMTKR